MADAPAVETSEEDATPEERMAWLRARGVTIEEPGQRSSPAATGSGSFCYVKIPADENAPCEQESGPHSMGDALPALLGPRFAGCSLSDEELSVQAMASGQSVDAKVLRSLMMSGRAESFRLAVPTDANGREGVYAYIDEASAMKGLPKNERASALARHCGFPAACEFRGDVYIGRQKWRDGGLVENVDFKLGELESGCAWMRRAITENLEHQKATRPEEHDAAQAGGYPEDKPASGVGDGYTWKDEGEELEIILECPEGTSKKDVKIEFKRQEVRVVKPKSLSLKLFKAVEVDGCSWTMGKPGQIVITLEKSSASPWAQLLS